jgi:hypothetical protein
MPARKYVSARPEVRQRRPELGEDLGCPVTAAEVSGLRTITQAPEVDHATDSLPCRHFGEVPGGPPLALLKVAIAAAPHRVDQVVRDLGPLARPAERLRIENVAFAQLHTAVGERPGAGRVSDQAANLPALVHERRDQVAPDEPRGAGYQCFAGHLSRY